MHPIRRLVLGTFLLCLSSCATTGAPSVSGPQVLAGFNTALCTAADITPEAREVYGLITSGNPSTADKVLTGLLTGLSTIGKAVACYTRNMATVRAQSAGGEVAAARRSDAEVIDSRAEVCDQAGQGYNRERCNGPALASWLLRQRARAGQVTL